MIAAIRNLPKLRTNIEGGCERVLDGWTWLFERAAPLIGWLRIDDTPAPTRRLSVKRAGLAPGQRTFIAQELRRAGRSGLR